MAEMNLYGATFYEVSRLIKLVTTEGERTTRAKTMTEYSYEIFGSPLRVKYQFNDKGLTMLSLVGKNWMLAFTVTKNRPRKLDQAIPHEMILLKGDGPWKSNWEDRVCIFNPAFLSPDSFREQMTILRMFASEWMPE